MPPKVYFNANPVQSTSRVLYRGEIRLLVHLEDHCYDCLACHRSSSGYYFITLCHYGRNLLREVNSLFTYRNGRYLDTAGEFHLASFVEIPRYYANTRRLLRHTVQSGVRVRCIASYDVGHESMTGSKIAGTRNSIPSAQTSNTSRRPTLARRSHHLEENTWSSYISRSFHLSIRTVTSIFRSA